MDPVTVAAVLAVTVLCTPLITRGAAIAYHLITEGKKKKAKKMLVKKARKYLKDKNYRHKVDKERALIQALNRSNNIKFTNASGTRSVNINVKTITDFDESKEIILRGKLHFRLPNSQVVTQPIFLFQPRCETADGKKVGPILTKKGRLYDQNPYLVKMPDTGEIVRSYVPKREVVSGMNFDFVQGSANFQDESLKRFLYIELETDENGNYIPVDLNDPKQLVGFRKYLQFCRTQENAAHYFSRIYETALYSSKVLAVKEAVAYRTQGAVETARESTPTGLEAQDPYAFYDRYNYNREPWLGAPGTVYDHNEDFVAHAMGLQGGPGGPPPGGPAPGGPRR